MKLYTAILPSGGALVSANFRKLFFVCAGFNWNPSAPAKAEIAIKGQTFAAFMREWQQKIDRGKAVRP